MLVIIISLIIIYILISINMTEKELNSNNLLRNKSIKNSKNVKYSKDWTLIKKQIKEDANFKCRICGSSENLQVHHKIPIKNGGTNIKENLILLCKSCHQKLHQFSFKEEYKPSSNNYGKYGGKNKYKQLGYKILFAIEHNYKLKIHYQYRKGYYKEGEVTVRTICPKSLKYAFEVTDNKFIQQSQYDINHNILFIDAFCELRQERRLFRIDRILDVEIIKK